MYIYMLICVYHIYIYAKLCQYMFGSFLNSYETERLPVKLTRVSSGEAGESEELPGSFSFRGYLDTGLEIVRGSTSRLFLSQGCFTSKIASGRS